ncbi:MAG TPA: hypothetical protein PLN21_01345 [Gemmatales bacterium]|nr:hypothetical protein [Gemmatales bacterium]
MQLSHVISDLFLTLSCVWVLYQCWKRHGHPLIFVWGLFFGAVGLAAFFGVLRFADVHPSMITISQSFQTIASTFGSCGLVAGVCWLFKRFAPVPLILWTTLAGVVCFLAGMLLEKPSYYSILQMIAMVAVLGIAVIYWFKPKLPEHRTIAQRLLLAIVLSAVATTSLRVLSEPYGIDAFHYLLGVGVLCFGWAARACDRVVSQS